jgi:phage terminase small subunit
MALTGKQELFAQSVASGTTQADAYRKAYNSGKMKAETIQRKACELMKDGKVSARVDSLRDDLSAKHLWTREDSVRALIGVVSSPDRAGDITAAVKELNSMHGFNAPTETNINGNLSGQWTVRIVDPKK